MDVEAKKYHGCDLCNKVLTSREGLKQHKETDHEKRRFACDKCDKTFTQRIGLQVHMK